MTPLVLDASVAVAWVAPTQANPRTTELLRSSERYDFIAPFLFPFELRSGLLKLERRRRLMAEETTSGLMSLELLQIEVMVQPDEQALSAMVELARQSGLRLFDALYIDLALRLEAPLASRDGPQLGAARRTGIAIMDLRAPEA